MLLQSFVPGCTKTSSLACKERMVFFPALFTAAITGTPPRVTPGKADHPTYALIHGWIATGPALCVCNLPADWQPQPLLHLPSKDGSKNQDCTPLQPAAEKEKSRQMSDTKEKCRTLSWKYKKMHSNVSSPLETCTLVLFQKASPPHLRLLMKFCWSECVLVSGRLMHYQRNWVFFSSWVYRLRSVISADFFLQLSFRPWSPSRHQLSDFTQSILCQNKYN